MGEPVAIERARQVLSHMRHLGGQLSEYCVTCTVDEGFELIDWLHEQARENPSGVNLALLEIDIAKAKRDRDPWIILDEYTVLGLPIKRRVVTH